MWVFLACNSAVVEPVASPVRSLPEAQILRPLPDVAVGIGFGLANVVVLEGPDGAVVIDSLEGATPARELLAAWRAQSSLPISALVLTHNHPDHSFGGGVFLEEGPIPVWAHEKTPAELGKLVNILRDSLQVRSTRMFGTRLDDVDDRGIGALLRYKPEDVALAWPDNLVSGPTPLRAGGLELELIPIPGETDDQLAVWWPAKKVLIAGDDIYEAFPNLYTIRGTAYRDVMTWVDSLDRMRDLGAELLIPMHTGPIQGAAEVEETLRIYRDAIQFVHDQTVRQMNKGKSADDIAATLRLPAALARHPYLQERYGRVSWSARGVYSGYLGWFEGDPARLEPLAPEERAKRYLAAFAAGRSLPQQVEEALAGKQWSWAAELALLWQQAEPTEERAKLARAQALEGMATVAENPNLKNWARTLAAELRGELVLKPTPVEQNPVSLIDSLPIDGFLRGLPTRLRAEDTEAVDLKVELHFPDIDRRYSLHVRGGVAELRQRPSPDAALRIETSAQNFKRLLSKKASALSLIADGELKLSGDPASLVAFLRLFDAGTD